MWKTSRKWLSFQGEGSFRLSMLKGIFPQKYKEVFGRFCIWKGQDSAHGNEGPGQGRELLRPGQACAATRDFRLPWPLLTECRQCPQGGAESAEQEGSGLAPAPLPGPSYLAPGASTGGLLGLSVRLSSVQFSRSVVSDSLWPHESHHARPPCPSPTPRVYSDYAHRVGDAIQPSHPLSSPSPPAPNPSQHQGLFQRVSSSHESFRLRVAYSGSHDSYSQLANPLQAWGHGLQKPWNWRSSGQFPLKCTEQMGPSLTPELQESWRWNDFRLFL